MEKGLGDIRKARKGLVLLQESLAPAWLEQGRPGSWCGLSGRAVFPQLEHTAGKLLSLSELSERWLLHL